MLILATENIYRFPHSDVELSEIAWLPDCGLRFDLVLGDGQIARLTCTWITELRMNLDLGKNSGKAMTSGIDYVSQGSRWQVRMDFAHAGTIELGCEEVGLEHASVR